MLLMMERSKTMTVTAEIESVRYELSLNQRERNALDLQYREFLLQKDDHSAVEAKRKIREAVDAAEILQDRLMVLEEQLPSRADVARAQKQLAADIASYEQLSADFMRAQDHAYGAFFDALRALEELRQQRADLRALRSQIHELAESVGIVRPDLEPVPEPSRHHAEKIVDSVTRLRNAVN